MLSSLLAECICQTSRLRRLMGVVPLLNRYTKAFEPYATVGYDRVFIDIRPPCTKLSITLRSTCKKRKEKKRTPHCLSKFYLTYAAKNSKKILSYMPSHIALVHLLHNIFETTGAVETCFGKCWFKGVKRAELTSIRADRKSSDDRTLTGAL
jgi:hypothetical protein